MKTLEEKILEAKKLGIIFKHIPRNQGCPQEEYNIMYVFSNSTNDEFESSLDEKIRILKEKTYLTILKSHDLI